MRILLLSIFAGIFMYAPLYMFDTFVEPQLDQLRYTYAHAEEIANEAAGINN